MARKYSSESSGQDESESSDYERRNRGKRDRESDRSGKWNERRDERVDDDGDDKDRERVNARDVRDRDGRSGQRSERVERKESSEEEDGELVERDVGRREGGRSRRYDEDDRRERERSRRYDEDDRRERERARRYESEHRRRESDDGGRRRDRREWHDSEENGAEREGRRKSERRNDRTDDYKHRRHRREDGDRDDKYRRDKEEVNEREKGSRGFREREDRDDKGFEDSKPQRQPRVQEVDFNADNSKLGKSGGVYIPPFKLARMMKEVQDKSSVEYQRLTWDALRKSINGLVNKVNAANVKNIIPELFSENLIRGRGLFCRSCMKSQMASPGFTDVFAALVAVVNTKFPEVGELLLRRIVLQLKRAYKRNDKVCFCLLSVISFDLLLDDGNLFTLEKDFVLIWFTFCSASITSCC